MSSQDDRFSDISSIEYDDGVIDHNFLANQKNTKVDLESGNDSTSEGCLSKFFQEYNDNQLLKRIAQHEAEELKVFIAQKLFKVDGILCDEETRLAMIGRSITAMNSNQEDVTLELHYGRDMANWLRERLFPAFTECSTVLKTAAKNFDMLRRIDPLCNWFYQPPEISGLVASRIKRFVDDMGSKVKWSFLIDPGSLSCHLTEFTSEFRRLELMTATGLAPGERAQSSFNMNYLTKARSKTIPCIDASRVKLIDTPVVLENACSALDTIFNDEDIGDDSQISYGTDDFIHASYVRGGPLLNTFICSQAPMENTVYDFWRMVYQERSKLIIMLCEAVDPSSLGPLGKLAPYSYCPYYWPRYEGDCVVHGNITIRNKRVDATIDPLFNVSYLEITKDDEAPLLVEHWQWDWQYMGDAHWPFRILRKARLSSSPTIVQCLDGCTRSGSLVTIETVLSHFLRGTPMDDNVVLLSSAFVRLQRKLAIGSPLHYLYVYRAVLQWVSPYVSSMTQRVSLGLSWKSYGFTAKFDDMVKLDSQSLRPF